MLRAESMREPPLVELRNIRKIYGQEETEVRALDGISMTIRDGEFIAVIGASGSGKSTAMNVIGALDRPTSGSYLFRGIEVAELSANSLALMRRNYIGFVFQGFNLLARTSAMENVELPLIYRRVPSAERRRLARKALHAVGLEGREHHASNELSGGQQQRVAIARAIVTHPALILADEPTGNLDTARKGEIMKLLTTLNREMGISVVMVTHESDIARWARRIVVFRDGVISDDRVNQPRAE